MAEMDTSRAGTEGHGETPMKVLHEKYNWVQFLEDQFLQATQTDGARLSKSMKAMAKTLSSKAASIFGPRPFLSIIPSPYFKVAFAGMALLYASLTCFSWLAFIEGGVSTGRTFTFDVLEVRDPALSPSDFQVQDFGVRSASCTRSDGVRTDSLSLASVTITFEDSVEFDRWFFTHGQNHSRDPVRLKVTVDNDEGGGWILERPMWWTDWGIVHKSSLEWAVDPAQERDAETEGHLHPPRTWSVGIISESLISFLCCAAVVVFALHGMVNAAQRSLALFLGEVLLQSLVVAILLCTQGEGWQSCRFWRACIVAALLFPAVTFPSLEKVFVPAVLAASMAHQLLLWLDYALVRRSVRGLLLTPDLYLGVMLLVLAGWLTWTWSTQPRTVKTE